jgi:hypothetical protein
MFRAFALGGRCLLEKLLQHVDFRKLMKKTPYCECLLLFVTGAFVLSPMAARANDYHVNSPQTLQNALTLAAASSVSNNIYVTNGYYTGNFNYNSANVNSLTLLAEPGVTNTQITIDSGGTGSSMNIMGSATANITVQGMTFLRNSGGTISGGLQIACGNTAILVNGCLFLSPTNSSGIGLEITSGLNATITNCVVVGTANSGNRTGISVSGVTGIVNVQNCTVVTNLGGGEGIDIFSASVANVVGSSIQGNGCGVSLSGVNRATLSANLIAGNGYGVPYGSGGVVYQGSGNVILSNNTFTGNRGNNYSVGGGGVMCYGASSATFTGNTFTGNTASSYYTYGGGGGVFCNATTATFTGNSFTGNSVGNGVGGGINCMGLVTLIGNTFTGNSATFSGGGASCSGGSTISGNTFQENTAVSGGGLYAVGPTINLMDNLVVKNAVSGTSSQGGGIWVDASATLNMINNTVTGNTSSGSGGGVAYVVTGTVELLNIYNNIIWGNLATVSGGDVYLSGTGQQKVFDFNDADSIYGVFDIALNNIDFSPQFFNPISGDYHTQSTSPCIAGGSTGAPSLPATDLDGNPRILNGTVDLGCYEFTTNVTHPADTNALFVITSAEFNAYAAAWKNALIWTNGPNPGPNPVQANYMTRAGYLMTNGGAYYNDGSARPVNWKTNSP